MYYTESGWRNVFSDAGALWIHRGNPKRPHALLTSGKHSTGFFNSEMVLEDPLLVDKAASDLVGLFGNKSRLSEVDRVTGPAMGAITLAHDIARHVTLGREEGLAHCLRAYTEKGKGEAEGRMTFERTAIKPGDRILLVEDVLTTGGSVEKTAEAVARVGGIVLPYVLVLVNRSGLEKVGERMIIALITHHMPIWEADDCLLCKQGSEAIRPKGAENWARLNVEV